MKYAIFLFFAGILNGCGCFFSVVSCSSINDIKGFPEIRAIQNIRSVGKTDPVKRKAVLYECGIGKNEIIDDNWSLYKPRSSDYITDGSCPSGFNNKCIDHTKILKRANAFYQCLETKGYKSFSCGSINNPTGNCN
ncbi:hypothetical protein [uncultured Actinobacillus sp.]|uniref:hypothetical protein n=1 Tax=uncultured Actinobacillus sp. TaxID=417616 RepID=UPI0025E1AE23|nr:hypothetical protein [uncultured Actinobacillus sp.]